MIASSNTVLYSAYITTASTCWDSGNCYDSEAFLKAQANWEALQNIRRLAAQKAHKSFVHSRRNNRTNNYLVPKRFCHREAKYRSWLERNP